MMKLLITLFFGIQLCFGQKINIDKTANRGRFDIHYGHLSMNDPLGKLGKIKAPFQFFKLKKEGNHPIVFVFPAIESTFPLIIEAGMSYLFASNNYHVVVVELVEDIAELDRPLNEIDDFFYRSHAAFLELKSQIIKFPGVDKNELYMSGISLGGIRGSYSFAQDPSIKKAYFLVTASNLPEIMTKSVVTMLTRYKQRQMEILKLKNDSEYLDALSRNINIDLENVAKQRRGLDDIFFVISAKDTYVTTEGQFEIAEAFDVPKKNLYILDQGHIMAGSNFFFNFENVLKFFGKGRI